jgi:NAD+ synthase (glutamine-hydrolysing)
MSGTQGKSAPHGFLRVGAGCPRVAVADPEQNLGFILEVVAQARVAGVQVLVLPELCLTGYTAGDLFFSLSTLVRGAERALARLLQETAADRMVIAVGLPVPHESRLFNVAAVLQSGRILGVVPKTYLPGYKEYYEERWFSSSREAGRGEVRLADQHAPFGTNLIFGLESEPAVTIGVEICEDLWAAVPPSSFHAVAGATVILNLSASNEIVAKAAYRRELVKVQSGRTLTAYAYANNGVHESTTDVVFAGQLLIAENAVLLAEGERFRRDGHLVATDVDTERLLVERLRQSSFAEAVHELPQGYRRIPVDPIAPPRPQRLLRAIDPHPFVPTDPATLDERCEEIFSMQTAGLAKRLSHTGVQKVTLGLSGGLDSTLALEVVVRTFEMLGLARSGILALTMPGFGTTSRTLESARRLALAAGVALREIDIKAACTQHMRDIGLPAEDTTSVTFQNLQARERTQVLMDVANLEGALNVGTGNLSEMALGWSTFAADQVSMYHVNSGVPKTLVRRLVSWVAEHRAQETERTVLRDILDTPVSPELVPPAADGTISQRTEELLGPYELHDFYLHCFVRLGAGPAKTLFLAEQAFAGQYDRAALARWLRTFLTRFFEQQYKRSMCPDGPKVGSVSLSPRGDWRMPSDAAKDAWLRELAEAEAES